MLSSKHFNDFANTFIITTSSRWIKQRTKQATFLRSPTFSQLSISPISSSVKRRTISTRKSTSLQIRTSPCKLHVRKTHPVKLSSNFVSTHRQFSTQNKPPHQPSSISPPTPKNSSIQQLSKLYPSFTPTSATKTAITGHYQRVLQFFSKLPQPIQRFGKFITRSIKRFTKFVLFFIGVAFVGSLIRSALQPTTKDFWTFILNLRADQDIMKYYGDLQGSLEVLEISFKDDPRARLVEILPHRPIPDEFYDEPGDSNEVLQQKKQERDHWVENESKRQKAFREAQTKANAEFILNRYFPDRVYDLQASDTGLILKECFESCHDIDSLRNYNNAFRQLLMKECYSMRLDYHDLRLLLLRTNSAIANIKKKFTTRFDLTAQPILQRLDYKLSTSNDIVLPDDITQRLLYYKEHTEQMKALYDKAVLDHEELGLQTLSDPQNVQLLHDYRNSQIYVAKISASLMELIHYEANAQITIQEQYEKEKLNISDIEFLLRQLDDLKRSSALINRSIKLMSFFTGLLEISHCTNTNHGLEKEIINMSLAIPPIYNLLSEFRQVSSNTLFHWTLQTENVEFFDQALDLLQLQQEDKGIPQDERVYQRGMIIIPHKNITEGRTLEETMEFSRLEHMSDAVPSILRFNLQGFQNRAKNFDFQEQQHHFRQIRIDEQWTMEQRLRSGYDMLNERAGVQNDLVVFFQHMKRFEDRKINAFKKHSSDQYFSKRQQKHLEKRRKKEMQLRLQGGVDLGPDQIPMEIIDNLTQFELSTESEYDEYDEYDEDDEDDDDDDDEDNFNEDFLQTNPATWTEEQLQWAYARQNQMSSGQKNVAYFFPSGTDQHKKKRDKEMRQKEKELKQAKLRKNNPQRFMNTRRDQLQMNTDEHYYSDTDDLDDDDDDGVDDDGIEMVFLDTKKYKPQSMSEMIRTNSDGSKSFLDPVNPNKDKTTKPVIAKYSAINENPKQLFTIDSDGTYIAKNRKPSPRFSVSGDEDLTPLPNKDQLDAIQRINDLNRRSLLSYELQSKYDESILQHSSSDGGDKPADTITHQILSSILLDPTTLQVGVPLQSQLHVNIFNPTVSSKLTHDALKRVSYERDLVEAQFFDEQQKYALAGDLTEEKYYQLLNKYQKILFSKGLTLDQLQQEQRKNVDNLLHLDESALVFFPMLVGSMNSLPRIPFRPTTLSNGEQLVIDTEKYPHILPIDEDRKAQLIDKHVRKQNKIKRKAHINAIEAQKQMRILDLFVVDSNSSQKNTSQLEAFRTQHIEFEKSQSSSFFSRLFNFAENPATPPIPIFNKDGSISSQSFLTHPTQTLNIPSTRVLMDKEGNIFPLSQKNDIDHNDSDEQYQEIELPLSTIDPASALLQQIAHMNAIYDEKMTTDSQNNRPSYEDPKFYTQLSTFQSQLTNMGKSITKTVIARANHDMEVVTKLRKPLIAPLMTPKDTFEPQSVNDYDHDINQFTYQTSHEHQIQNQEESARINYMKRVLKSKEMAQKPLQALVSTMLSPFSSLTSKLGLSSATNRINSIESLRSDEIEQKYMELILGLDTIDVSLLPYQNPDELSQTLFSLQSDPLNPLVDSDWMMDQMEADVENGKMYSFGGGRLQTASQPLLPYANIPTILEETTQDLLAKERQQIRQKRFEQLQQQGLSIQQLRSQKQFPNSPDSLQNSSKTTSSQLNLPLSSSSYPSFPFTQDEVLTRIHRGENIDLDSDDAIASFDDKQLEEIQFRKLLDDFVNPVTRSIKYRDYLLNVKKVQDLSPYKNVLDYTNPTSPFYIDPETNRPNKYDSIYDVILASLDQDTISKFNLDDQIIQFSEQGSISTAKNKMPNNPNNVKTSSNIVTTVTPADLLGEFDTDYHPNEDTSRDISPPINNSISNTGYNPFNFQQTQPRIAKVSPKDRQDFDDIFGSTSSPPSVLQSTKPQSKLSSFTKDIQSNRSYANTSSRPQAATNNSSSTLNNARLGAYDNTQLDTPMDVPTKPQKQQQQQQHQQQQQQQPQSPLSSPVSSRAQQRAERRNQRFGDEKATLDAHAEKYEELQAWELELEEEQKFKQHGLVPSRNRLFGNSIEDELINGLKEYQINQNSDEMAMRKQILLERQRERI